MTFDNNVPEWKNEGSDPPDSLKKEGFIAGYKPPAAYFNWFFNRIQKSVKEIQDKLSKDLKAMAFKENISGEDISETVIETLDTIEDKYPLPAAGENVKRFFGKVLTFLRNIRPLTSDITLYVSANTGSDISGDGSQANSFKTIQHAIDIIPKDLGGYTANVIIAGGTYDEDVHIAGFYPGTGRIMGYLSGNVVIRGFTVSGSHVILSSYDSVLHNLTAQYVLVQDIATLNMWAQINLTTTGYIVDPLTTTSRISIISTRNSALYLSGTTTITGNDAVGVFVGNMSQAYIAIITGSGFTVGIYSVTGSRVSIVSNLISAITPYAQTGGGIFTYGNGTQISGIISSGLSCTWGTLGGGYIRHGNMVGTAMVTISLEVATTSTLSQGVDYVINGVPLPIGVSVVVSHNYATQIGDCFIDGYTTHIRIKPQSSIAIGTHILFTVTYLTVS